MNEKGVEIVKKLKTYNPAFLVLSSDKNGLGIDKISMDSKDSAYNCSLYECVGSGSRYMDLELHCFFETLTRKIK